jgi:peptidoglycan hydrolase CwlO-like protein
MDKNKPGDSPKRRTMSRRSLLRLAAGAGTLAAVSSHPVFALADTQSDLDAAEQQYAEVQKQLDQIGTDYAAISQKQSETLDEIYDVQTQIDDVTQQISDKEASLKEKRERLASNVSSNYKDGNTGVVDMLLGAKSIEELVSNVYYFDRISKESRELIDSINEEKQALDQNKADLEAYQENLQVVQAQQAEQLQEMQDKQAEAQQVLTSLDAQVKQLMEQRDAEILAAQEEEKRQQEAKAAADAAAAASAAQSSEPSSAGASTPDSGSTAGSSTSGGSTTGGSTSGGSSSGGTGGAGTGSASAVVSACYSTPSPGAGLCAMWVSQVFSNAGYGYGSGNACDMYNAYCYSSNRADLKPGMIVAVSSHPQSSMGRIYGHIGIYVGNNTIMHNIGSVATWSMDQWISYYGTTVTPRWGWFMNITLS